MNLFIEMIINILMINLFINFIIINWQQARVQERWRELNRMVKQIFSFIINIPSIIFLLKYISIIIQLQLLYSGYHIIFNQSINQAYLQLTFISLWNYSFAYRSNHKECLQSINQSNGQKYFRFGYQNTWIKCICGQQYINNLRGEEEGEIVFQYQVFFFIQLIILVIDYLQFFKFLNYFGIIFYLHFQIKQLFIVLAFTFIINISN
ncbi:hypothetical protein ABPG72_002936 [Tetrahymena utriculariae]